MPHRLAQHLISRGLLPASKVDEALKRHAASEGVCFDTVLLELGAISEAGVLQAMADVSGVRLVNLSDFEPNKAAAQELPLKIAQRLNVVPLSVEGNTLHLAVGYPVPHAQLKEVGFLLGKPLELWVSIEARRRDWMAQLYQLPLPTRFAALLAAVDPSRRPTEGPTRTESLSEEVLERIAQGIVEEPVLLSRRKGEKATAGEQKPTLEVMDEEIPPEESTSVIDTAAYAAYARGGAPGTDEESETSVLDLGKYAAFAREVSKPDAFPPPDRLKTDPAMPAVKIPTVAPVGSQDVSFPGGVMPPSTARSTRPPKASPPGRPAEPEWLTAAPATRPHSEPIKLPPTGPGQAVAPPPPPLPSKRELEKLERVPDTTPVPRAPKRTETGTAPFGKGAPVPPPIDAWLAAPAPRPSIPAQIDAARHGAIGVDGVAAIPPAALPPPRASGSGPQPASPPPSEPPRMPVSTQSVTARAGIIGVDGAGTPFPKAPPEPEPRAGSSSVTIEPSRPRVAALPAQAPAAPIVPPGLTGEWTLAQARAALKNATHDREALVDVALTFGRRVFDFVSAFAVVRGAAYGWDARGEGDASVIRGVAIPLDAASVFRTVALTRGSYMGPLPPDALSQHYLALLGRGPRAVFLWPVEVKSRLVAMFYGDCAHRPISQRKLADFILFCQDLPAAFSELILYRKQHAPAAPFHPQAEQSPELPAGQAVDVSQAQANDADWFNGLLRLLTGPEPTERLTAMAELLRTPEASARSLAAVFPGPTGWSRLPVVERPEADELGPIPGALARLGQWGATAIAPLLDSDDSDARYLALLTAGSVPYSEVVDGVLRGLFDLEPDISSAARAAATALKAEPRFISSMKGLRQELTSRDPLRRSLAARALGVLHDREGVEGLINLTGSDDALCAQSAAEALREITRAAFGTQQRQWTSWWAQARDKRRVEWLIDALESNEFDSRLAAIDELTRTLGDNLGYLADASEAERSGAVHRWRELLADQPQLEV